MIIGRMMSRACMLAIMFAVSLSSLSHASDDLLTEVTFLKKLVRRNSQPQGAKSRSSLDKIISMAARETGVEKAMIKSIIKVESAGNQFAVSKKGACGYTQLMPRTAKMLGVRNIFDPVENIVGGALYYRMMLESGSAASVWPCGPIIQGRLLFKGIRFHPKAEDMRNWY